MPVMPCWVRAAVRLAATRARLASGARRRGWGRVRRVHRFLASGWPAWSSVLAGGVSRGLPGGRVVVVLMVADLPGDLAQAARREAERAFGDRDISPADGVQVEALVQGAEDAGRQVIAAGRASRGGARHRGWFSRPGRVDAGRAPGGRSSCPVAGGSLGAGVLLGPSPRPVAAAAARGPGVAWQGPERVFESAPVSRQVVGGQGGQGVRWWLRCGHRGSLRGGRGGRAGGGRARTRRTGGGRRDTEGGSPGAADPQAALQWEPECLARVKDWWHQYSGAIPEWFQFYVGLEAAASAMQEYNAELVTGLLQTEPYIRAVMAAAMRADHNDEMERQIKVRMERQKRLTAPDAPTLWVVLNEAVLHRQVGGPAVMRDQLAHIADVAGLGNVTVQVLP